MEHKWHEGQKKGLNSTKWIKGEKPRTGKKKRNPAGGMDVVFVVQGLVWIISDMKKNGRI
jgi:hypothetical protein